MRNFLPKVLAFQTLQLVFYTRASTNFGVTIPFGSVCVNYLNYANGDINCIRTATCQSLRKCQVGQYYVNCEWTNQPYCEYCIGCSPGTYMIGCDGTGYSSSRFCDPCEWGEYDSDPSGYNTDCTHCPLGKSTVNRESTSVDSCIPCSPGYYNNRQPSRSGYGAHVGESTVSRTHRRCSSGVRAPPYLCSTGSLSS